MNLQECKEQIAHEYCFQDWGQVQRTVGVDEMGDLLDAVAKLYASEKVKEALKLAAERARINLERDEPSNHNLQIQSYTYEDGTIFTINKDSILSLETELLNQIDNEE